MKAMILSLVVIVTAQIASAELPNNLILDGEQPVVVAFKDKDYVARFAELNVSYVDPQLEKNLGNTVLGAQVLTDVPNSKVFFTLEVSPCLGKEVCAAVIQYIVMELPLVSSEFDSCGTKIIIAEEDKRPVDGSLNRVVIRDNTQNNCPTLIALAPTEVAYETAFAGFVNFDLPVESLKTYSTFVGSELLPMKK